MSNSEVIDVEFRKHPGCSARTETVQHLEQHAKKFSHSDEDLLKKFNEAVQRNQQILLEKKEKAAQEVQKAKQHAEKHKIQEAEQLQKLGETLSEHCEMANYLHALQLKHVQEAGSHEVEHAKLVAQRHKKELEEQRVALEEAINMDQQIAEHIKKVNLNMKALKAQYQNTKADLKHAAVKEENEMIQETMDDLMTSKQELADALRAAHIEMKRFEAASEVQHSKEVHDHVMNVRQYAQLYREKVERALEVVADKLVSLVEGITLGFYA